MSATILPMCYALVEILGLSKLNDINNISFDVPGHIYPKQLNSSTSQQLCLLAAWIGEPIMNQEK